MAKLRTKCCPFCGCDQVTIHCDRVFNKYYSMVSCDQCGASSPSVTDSELMDGFIEAATEEEIVAAMKELAATRWNCRPPMTDVFPEDLAAFEQFGETTESLEKEAEDARLQKIEDLVDGTIDHFDKDDAMDLLYQIKDVLKLKGGALYGSSVYKD